MNIIFVFLGLLHKQIEIYKKGKSFLKKKIIVDKSTNLFIAMKKDKKYWGNPQVYIVTAAEAVSHEAHFILFNFKTDKLQPLDHSIRGLNMMGDLQYKVTI